MNRLKFLREQAGMTQAELGKLLNVKDAAISKYESGRVPLTGDTLLQLSRIFNVSIDYLLGKDASPNNDDISERHYFFLFFDEENTLRSVFSMRIKAAIANMGLSEDAFKEQISFGAEKAESFLNETGEPTANDLIELSHFLNTSIDYLLGQEPKINTAEKKILNTFCKLNEDNQDILIGKAKELLKEQEREKSILGGEPSPKTGTDNLGK